MALEGTPVAKSKPATDPTKAKRRSRLTLAERLADVDDSITHHEQKLRELRNRRNALVQDERDRVRAAQAQIDAATGEAHPGEPTSPDTRPTPKPPVASEISWSGR